MCGFFIAAWEKFKRSDVLLEVKVWLLLVFFCQMRKIHENICEFQISMHHIMLFYGEQTIYYLTQDNFDFGFCQEATSRLNETLKVATIAVLHDQVVVAGCLRGRNQRYHIILSNFLHDIDFIEEKLLRVALETPPVNHFDCVG